MTDGLLLKSTGVVKLMYKIDCMFFTLSTDELKFDNNVEGKGTKNEIRKRKLKLS